MTGLFIRVYLDEDVDSLVARLLRSRGFAATTTQEANRLGRSDAEQLAFATENSLALLTHNRVDFESLAVEYQSAAEDHGGLIIATRRTPYEITRRLLVILNSVTADEMANQIRYI